MPKGIPNKKKIVPVNVGLSTEGSGIGLAPFNLDEDDLNSVPIERHPSILEQEMDQYRHSGLLFAIDGDTWTMTCRGMIDSGTLHQPIENIKRCADRLITA